MLVTGRIAQLAIFLIMTAMVLLYIMRASAGKLPKIRRIPALDGLNEAIGRCTEMGRTLHYTPGRWGLTDPQYAPETIAGMSILADVSTSVAKYGVSMICTVASQELIPMAEGLIRNAYLAENRLGLYENDTVRFIPGGGGLAYFAGVMAVLEREKCGANIMVGGFLIEALLFAEVGFTQGAIQVAGTTEISAIPFFVTVCDYTLIGEEIFSAAAQLSGDPVQQGSIGGEDLCKFLIIGLILAVVFMATLGNNWIVNLLKA